MNDTRMNLLESVCEMISAVKTNPDRKRYCKLLDEVASYRVVFGSLLILQSKTERILLADGYQPEVAASDARFLVTQVERYNKEVGAL